MQREASHLADTNSLKTMIEELNKEVRCGTKSPVDHFEIHYVIGDSPYSFVFLQVKNKKKKFETQTSQVHRFEEAKKEQAEVVAKLAAKVC